MPSKPGELTNHPAARKTELTPSPHKQPKEVTPPPLRWVCKYLSSKCPACRQDVAGCRQDVAGGSRFVAPQSRVGRRPSRRRRGLSRRRRGRVAARRAAVAARRGELTNHPAACSNRRVARCRGVLRGVEGGSPPITPPSRAGRHPSRRRRGLSRGVAGVAGHKTLSFVSMQPPLSLSKQFLYADSR